MNFSEKLSALLPLTATKNIDLAHATNLDAAQISRMRSGIRKNPPKPDVIQTIALYFAGCFDSEYRLSALYELTGDTRLQSFTDEHTLADIIYDWLISVDLTPKTQIGRFLNRLGEFSMHDLEENLPESSAAAQGIDSGTGFVAYYGNAGKRKAVLDLAASILSLDRPFTLRVFTDECMDWLLEDRVFTRELSGCVSQISQKDCSIQRIRPPDQSLESVFRSIERWLPAYMSGTLTLYHYPRARDELHRRTIFVVPGLATLCSDSICGQRETPMTILTTDATTVRLTDEHFDHILERCRPMMSVHMPDKLLSPIKLLESFSQVEDFGLAKSSRLSVFTMPSELLLRIRQRATPCVQKMCDSYERSMEYRAKILQKHAITDILCLPGLDSVKEGKVIIPGTKMSKADSLYYTPEEYGMHLEHILWYLDTFPNYEAVLLDEPLFENITLFVKGDSYALLIKETDPFAIFEITEQMFASSLCEYLRYLTKEQMQNSSRHATIDKLKDELRRIKKA